MESDYLTKVLQGKSFNTHRKTLMGLEGINEHMFYINTRMIKFPAIDIVTIISPLHDNIYISVQVCVGYQKITLWIYHVHPTRKKRAGHCLNLTPQ